MSETPMVQLLHRLNVMQDRTPEQEAESGAIPDGVVAVFLTEVLDALEEAWSRARYLTADYPSAAVPDLGGPVRDE